MQKQQTPKTEQPEAQPRWQRPAIEWEESYEPVVFAVSCSSQPLNCGGAARL